MSGIPYIRSMSTHESNQWFTAKLTQEVLENERLRLTYLGAFFSIMFLMFAGMIVLFPGLFDLINEGADGEQRQVFMVGLSPMNFFFVSGLTVNVLIILYAFIGRFWVQKVIHEGKSFPSWVKYFILIFETSIPTLFLISIGAIAHPDFVLISPAVFLYFPFIILSVLRLNPWFCLITGVVAAIEYAGLSLWVPTFSSAEHIGLAILSSPLLHVGKSLVLLFSGVLAALVTTKIRSNTQNSLNSLHDRNRILGLFGQHVSPEVVQRLLDQKVGEEVESRHVCVMFLDIRNFTGFSENRGPEEIIVFLNSLFDFMIEIINEHGGIINKFLGDGFLAIFGAPISGGDDSLNALKASFAILEKIEEKITNGELPNINIGIGLHAGNVVAGNIGSRLRKEYTIIGDVVNVAARIEGMNKQFGSTLLISETTLEGAPTFREQAEDIGEIQVKGRDAAVRLYRLA